MLLENQIENICHTGSSEQARAYDAGRIAGDMPEGIKDPGES